MQRVIAVTALEPYKICVRFCDGVAGMVDISSFIGHGVFAKLADPSIFAQVYVDPVTHTVAWPDGIDLCPDSLYKDLLAQQEQAA